MLILISFNLPSPILKHFMDILNLIVSGLGRLQDQSNWLRIWLLENTMIMITFILTVIDYNYDYIVK